MRRARALAACAIAVALTGCSQAPEEVEGVNVVASTSILADVVRNVAGDNAEVKTLIRRGADPHSYEPTLHNTRDIAYADAVFTNGLLLEPQALTRTIDATCLLYTSDAADE